MLLGVDVGGTFTDAVLVDGQSLYAAKAPTTPADQAEGVLAAVDAVLAASGRGAADVKLFAHGMTVATNALLEGDAARTVLVATEGFTDVVELGRQARRDLYRLCAAHPAPLVPPERRVGARERTTPDGVLRALEGDVAGAVVEGLERAVDAHALGYAEAQLGRSQRRRVRGAQAIQVGPGLPPQLHQVDEALGGDQRGAGGAALEQGIGGHGHAVGELLDVTRLTARALECRADGCEHPHALIAGRRRGLRGEGRSLRDQDGVGERPADVHAQQHGAAPVRRRRA